MNNNKAMLNQRPMIRLEGIGKRVVSPEGSLTILDDINFSIAKAEVVAIVGVSGSGKSTLLGLMAGLDTPSAGRIHIDGEDLSDLSEDQRARLRGERMGFVFQSFQLLPNLTALENVMLPLELRALAAARERALAILEQVGLTQRALHYPRQLSGGEQQRVAIARAFACKPAILLADEPTGNLDQATARMVIDLLFSLNTKEGSTLVLVTHDEAIASRCTRSLHLDAGRLMC